MATHIASKDRDPLSGLVERGKFHSPETGFCVLRIKIRGHRELVTVLGSAASRRRHRPGQDKIGLANLTYNMRRTVGFRGDVCPHGAKPPSAGVDQAKGNKTPGKSYLSMTPEPAPCRNWSQNSGSSVCPMVNMAACVLIHSRPEFC